MADGDAYEVDSSLIASECGHHVGILLCFFVELLVASEVHAEADLKENEGAVLAVEGLDVRGRVGRHSSGVDDVGAAPAPTAIKLSRSSCGYTHAGMYRGAFLPSSSRIAATPCEGRVFVSMNTSTWRFLSGMGAMRAGSLSQPISGKDICVVRSFSSRVKAMSSVTSSSDVWCLVPASILTSRRSCGEYTMPPPFNADLIAAWVSWQAALCLRIDWSLWVLHCPAMCVHESKSPHSEHASVGACFYL